MRLARIFAVLAAPALGWGQIEQTYIISTFAGGNGPGFSGDGGPATAAQLSQPTGIAFDASGNLYIADQNNQRIRQVSNGTISSPAGSGTMGYAGDGKAATAADLNAPLGVLVDSSGNLYIADTGNDVIRKVTTDGNISTVAGNYGAGAGYGGDGGNPTGAIFNQPSAIAMDSAGNLYICDTLNHRVRKANFSTNVTSTVAGNGNASFSGDGGKAIFAALSSPRGVAVDAAGNVYISDSDNNRIRKVTPAGIITTIAGNGTPGFSGDGGAATDAQLNRPRGIALDAAGNLYIADYLNSRIRMVSNGIIRTIAGTAGYGNGGDGGFGTSALLNFPAGVAVDSSGKVYIADTQNNAIRVLTPIASPPIIKKGGVQSAGAFGAFFSVAPGSWMEIYGSSLAPDARSWSAQDFTGIYAPYQLDTTTVTVGGQYAFLSYVSGNQVNVQVPTTIGPGPQTLYLSTSAGTSAPVTVNVNAVQPGLYAPPPFVVNGKQYVGATFADGTYVAPAGAIPGVTSRPAKPGETIILYGIGFGPVTPDTPAGQIATVAARLNTSLQVMFGQTPAQVAYAGLAPGSVGLYQINVVVPNIAGGDLVPLTFTLGGVAGAQTLYTAVAAAN